MTFDKYAVANKLEEIHRLSLDNQSREAKAKGFATATFRWSANICAPRATSALFGHTTHSLGTSNRADVLIKRYEQNTPRNIRTEALERIQTSKTKQWKEIVSK